MPSAIMPVFTLRQYMLHIINVPLRSILCMLGEIEDLCGMALQRNPIA
jgi:hypothetical protein